MLVCSSSAGRLFLETLFLAGPAAAVARSELAVSGLWYLGSRCHHTTTLPCRVIPTLDHCSLTSYRCCRVPHSISSSAMSCWVDAGSLEGAAHCRRTVPGADTVLCVSDCRL